MDQSFDLFDYLPEALLIVIISFLPFRDAVRTSILSKRWYRMWIYATSLDFDERYFTETIYERPLHQNDQSTSYQVKRVRRSSFVKSVDYTLKSLQMPSLSKLELNFWYNTTYHSTVCSWINFFLEKNIEELHLDFSGNHVRQLDFDSLNEPNFYLPESVYRYGYRSIRVLNLNSCNLGLFNFRRFNVLRTVSLSRLQLPTVAVRNLVNNCPLLEVLSLEECRSLSHINISRRHLGLRKVIVRDCRPLSLGIDLFAPNLQYLEYFGSVVVFYLDSLVSLREVVLDFGLERMVNYYSVEFSDLIYDLYRTKALTVCGYLLKILPLEDYYRFKLPYKLNNLKHLTMITSLDTLEVVGMLCLLRSSPCLQTLSIKMCLSLFTSVSTPEEVLWDEFEIELHHLKKVEVQEFQGSVNEIGLLRFLLRNARDLEAVIIEPHLCFLSTMDELRGFVCAPPYVRMWYLFTA